MRRGPAALQLGQVDVDVFPELAHEDVAVVAHHPGLRQVGEDAVHMDLVRHVGDEQFLGRVMITPYLHRVHHSTQRVEHDRNYGAVLSIWDRLFGTLAELKPAAIGINGNSTQDIIELIKFGFISQTQPSVQPANLDAMIAEAAYYKAEKRGFYPGNDLRDWLEAKSEIIRLIYGEEQVKTSLMQKWKDLAGFVDNTLTAKNRKYQQLQNQIN